MTDSSEFYTVSMARLYAEQGYLRKAAEIYRHLVDRHPKDPDLNRALAEIERKMDRQQGPTRKDTALLLREWIDLLKQKKRKERKR